MAMIDPPIDELVEKVGNKYAISSIVSKRAKELILKRPEYFFENYRVKPLEVATFQLARGEYRGVKVKND